MKIKVDPEVLKALLVLASIIEGRDPYTGGHPWRISRYSLILGKRYGLDEHHLFRLEIGAMVHDMGKIGITDSMLTKQGALSESETSVMRQHPVVGAEIARNHPLGVLVKQAITEHHERVDGTGYPCRIDGDAISVWGKIIAIADAFDAMTSVRPYRKPVLAEEAYSRIEADKGLHFDSRLAEQFVELGRDGAFSGVIGHAGDDSPMLACGTCGPVMAPRSDLQDGETIQCPVCTSRYRAHKSGDGFVVELTGGPSGIHVPRADEAAIRRIVAAAKRKVRI